MIQEELEQISEYGWNDLKVGDTVTMKNDKNAKVIKLGGKGKGFPRNFVKIKPSSGKEEVVGIDDLKESKQVSETMTKQQAAETLLQLGGRKFMMMVNAKLNPILGPKGFGFSIMRNSKGVNYVRINLNSMDTYDIEFIFTRAGKDKIKSTAKGVYADQLQDTFEQHTNLSVRMPKFR